MRKLFLLFALSILATVFSQGEQLYADGVDTDQDGNEFEWISYGDQDWAIENAEVLTYKDGTPIPEVTNNEDWSNLTTGAWRNIEGNIFYNWYAIMGIHDNDSNTPNKEFAPNGWTIPSDTDWNNLLNYLISNGYNHDATSNENKLAKAMASTTWPSEDYDNETCGNGPGANPSTNNLSGFNMKPGWIDENGNGSGNTDAPYWSKTFVAEFASYYNIDGCREDIFNIQTTSFSSGFSVRFVKNPSTASINDFSKDLFSIYPNPTKEYLNIDCSSLESVSVYHILGKELIKDSNNRINVSSLSKGVYFIKVSDGINSSTKKFIKN